MRDLTKVIEQMYAVIPGDEVDLLAGLQRIRDSASFAPPESQPIWWREAAHHLAYYFPDQDKLLDWHEHVLAIWNDMPYEPELNPIIVVDNGGRP